MLYFAYGSNMNHEQMRKRCPQSHFLFAGYLEGYAFVYDGFSKNRKGPVANVVSKSGSVVWGGVFDIDDSDLESLDRHEGYPSSYDRSSFIVKNTDDFLGEAIVYFRAKQKEGKPSKEYSEVVLQGALDCGLPEEYTKSVLWTDI